MNVLFEKITNYKKKLIIRKKIQYTLSKWITLKCAYVGNSMLANMKPPTFSFRIVWVR